MFAIFCKEIRSFFCSITAYSIIGFFVVAMWLALWVLPNYNIIDDGYASLYRFFSICPYLFSLLIPAITMQSFVDERRFGTLELLFAIQISRLDIFLAKFFAYFSIVFAILLLSTINYFILWHLSMPIGSIDTSIVIGSYFGLLLLAVVFINIGMLASLLTSKQVVALLLGAALCIFFYQGFSSLGVIASWSKYSLFISILGLKYHYEELSKGVIDSRNVLYFITISYGLVYASKKILDRI